MIGQDKLQNKINQYTITSFPQSILLEGAYGSGKHLICELISDKFNLPIKDISKDISWDNILNYFINPIPTLYVIDIIGVRQVKRVELIQNSILKFIEEPPQNAKIVILCENRNQILDTIQNRCQIFSFEPYSVEQLKEYSSQMEIPILDDYLYSIYDTPGKLNTILNNSKSIYELQQLVINMISNIHKANVSNVLSIADKFDFGKGEYNVSIFLSMMKHELCKQLLTTEYFARLKYYYLFTQKCTQELQLMNVNPLLVFESYLLNLKSVE